MIDFLKLLKINGFPVEEAINEFNNIPDRHHLTDWQKGKLWEVFNYHYNHNSSYRFLFQEIPRKWEDIPVMDKCKLTQCFEDGMQDKSMKYYIQKTSGSTGTPFKYSLDYKSHVLKWLLISKRYGEAGVSLNARQARFYGRPIPYRQRFSELAKDFVANRYRFPIIDLSDKSMEKWLKIFKNIKFRYLYGYSFPIITFSKFLLGKNIDLLEICPTLKCIIVTSEVCSAEDQAIVERATKLPVYNEYGSSELGIIGFGKTNEWQVSDELMYMEIVDDDGNILPDGEIGRVVCTPFFSLGTPFIRYDLGDLAAIQSTPQGKMIKRLEGRREELAILPSGKKAPGDTAFYYVFKAFVEDFKEVYEYRVIQKSLSFFEILVVASRDPNHQDISHLGKLIKQYLEPGLSFELKRVSVIERSKVGKFRRFISEIVNDEVKH